MTTVVGQSLSSEKSRQSSYIRCSDLPERCSYHSRIETRSQDTRICSSSRPSSRHSRRSRCKFACDRRSVRYRNDNQRLDTTSLSRQKTAKKTRTIERKRKKRNRTRKAFGVRKERGKEKHPKAVAKRVVLYHREVFERSESVAAGREVYYACPWIYVCTKTVIEVLRSFSLYTDKC